MAQNVKFSKKVFNKSSYQKTIDTSFTELGVSSIQEQIDEQPTIQEFFDMYNTLFYDIPELGETNSHEFLIKTSSEYVTNPVTDDLIEALQEEIAQLREELLESQQDIINNIDTE